MLTVLTLIAVLMTNHCCKSIADTTNDYWNEDYDESKNCISEDEINKLKEINLFKKQCSLSLQEDANEALQQCKSYLTKKIIHECKMSKIKKAGDLLYCYNRGYTMCCFDKHECEADRVLSAEYFPELALEYLKDKEGTLKNIQQELGFHSCHPINGYDATKCAEDCNKIKKDTPLALECAKRNGFMNCCIRRDKRNCHECRYCCTLPFCTYMNNIGEIHHIGEIHVKDGNYSTFAQKNVTISAIEDIYARSTMLKQEDKRCLKPYSHDNPEVWFHYDPDEFATALSQTELDQGMSVPFDKRFFNYEDPEVFDAATGEDFAKIFAQAYGYDFAGRVEQPHMIWSNTSLMAPCGMECLRAEQSQWADGCRSEGGVFKCCIETLSLEVYDTVRRKLSEEDLISSYNITCGDDGCSSKCWFCLSTYICTKRDKATGNITQLYKTQDFNYIGGIVMEENKELKRIPAKASFCIKQDYCQLKEMYYDTQTFLAAENQEDLCNVRVQALNTESQFESQDEFIETPEDCKKRVSNVRICPDSLLDKIENPVTKEVLKEINKEMRQIQNMNGSKGKHGHKKHRHHKKNKRHNRERHEKKHTRNGKRKKKSRKEKKD